MWEGIDQRKFPRAEYPCKVIIMGSGAKEAFSTHTQNIGTGGICVVLAKELPRFFPVRIVLYLKDKKGPLECNGRIIWSIKTAIDFDTGIEFMEINSAGQMRIEKIIQECLRK
jgi:hypothetical protein